MAVTEELIACIECGRVVPVREIHRYTDPQRTEGLCRRCAAAREDIRSPRP